jgi:predicted amidohydrolase
MMPSPPESSLRVACIQTEPVIGDKAHNLKQTLTRVAEAAAAGANLVVLPELCSTGYVFATRQEAFALAEPVPEGPTTAAWAEAAARHDLHIVAGIAERDGDVLYNSAVVVGPQGYVGRYRKNHLWAAENLFFEPGNLGMPVFRIGAGRIAVAICYDIWFPETFRLARKFHEVGGETSKA